MHHWFSALAFSFSLPLPYDPHVYLCSRFLGKLALVPLLPFISYLLHQRNSQPQSHIHVLGDSRTPGLPLYVAVLALKIQTSPGKKVPSPPGTYREILNLPLISNYGSQNPTIFSFLDTLESWYVFSPHTTLWTPPLTHFQHSEHLTRHSPAGVPFLSVL